MINFACSGCGKNLQVKNEFGGRKTKCPRCSAVLTVPTERPEPATAGNKPKIAEQVARIPHAPSDKRVATPRDDVQGRKHTGQIINEVQSRPRAVAADRGKGPSLLSNESAHGAERIVGKQWHYTRGGKQAGPVSGAELKQLVTSGQLSRADMVWKDSMSNWMPAETVEGLFSPQATMPPPLVPHAAATATAGPRTHVTIVTPTKSMGISILLTLLFGPMGMLYSTVPGGIIMMVVHFFVFSIAFCTAGFGLVLLVITWPICLLWGALATSSYNKKLVRGLREY